MSENKCCGNCKHFKDVDADGFVQCNRRQFKYRPFRNIDACEHYEILNGGWTEITPDNVDEVRNTDVGRLMIAVITHGKPYYMEYREMFRELDEMAILGGYYYLVLPELKLED